jgi:heptaprenyl diphosphate synthase
VTFERGGGPGEAGALASSLGIDERRFALPGERRFAKAIEDGLALVEAELQAEIQFADSLADVSGRYLLEAGGKRVRPVLALLTAQLGDGATSDVVRAAAAIEITHLASLYHDDVMDEAVLRRGVPSAHSVYGNSIAIITGDLLFARASRLIADLGIDALRMQADTFERLCLGQLHELAGPAEGVDPIEHYLRVLSDKTGSLIATAAETGVRFSGADPKHIPAVRTYGERVGIAFQLADDVIDITDAQETTGKVPGTDLRADVPTMPLLLLRRAADTDPAAAELAARIDATAAAANDEDATPAERVERDAAFLAAVADLRAHDVATQTIAEAHRWAAAAVAALDSLPAGPVKRALTEFADRVVERDA